MSKLWKRFLTTQETCRLIIKKYPLLLGNIEERTHIGKQFGEKGSFWASTLILREDGLANITPDIIKRLFSLLENFQENKVDIEKMCTPSLYKSIEWFHTYFDQNNAKLKLSVEVKEKTSRIRKQTHCASFLDRKIDFLDFGINAKMQSHPEYLKSDNHDNLITHGSSLGPLHGKIYWKNFSITTSQEVLTKVHIAASFSIKNSDQEVELFNDEITRDLSLRFDLDTNSNYQYKLSDIDNAIFSSYFIDQQN